MTREYIALDLETTGLRPGSDKILEIGAARICDGVMAEEFQTFVNPGIKIPVYIRELTGIDDGMAKSGISQKDAVRQLVDFCGELPILGHNILFDYSFVKGQAVNDGLKFEKNGIDTLQIARKFLGELPSRNLGALCNYYGIKSDRSHRALYDALAASKLYDRLLNDFLQVSPMAFEPKPLICKVKKQNPITKFQKAYLNDLIKYHRIELNVSMDSMTKNDASRFIDQIISQNGRIKR